MNVNISTSNSNNQSTMVGHRSSSMSSQEPSTPSMGYYCHVVERMSNCIMERLEERFQQQRNAENNDPAVLLCYTKRAYHAIQGICSLVVDNKNHDDTDDYEKLAEYFAYGYLDVSVFAGDPAVLNHVGGHDTAVLRKSIHETVEQIQFQLNSNTDKKVSKEDGLDSENVSAVSNHPLEEILSLVGRNAVSLLGKDPFLRTTHKHRLRKCMTKQLSTQVSPSRRDRIKSAWKQHWVGEKLRLVTLGEQKAEKEKHGSKKTLHFTKPVTTQTTPSKLDTTDNKTSSPSTPDYIPAFTAEDGWATPYPNDFFRLFIQIVYDAKKDHDTSLYLPIIIYATVDSTYLHIMEARSEDNIQGAVEQALQIPPFRASNVLGLRSAIFAYIEKFQVGDMVLYRKQMIQDYAFVRAEPIKAQITRICRDKLVETGDVQLRLFISCLPNGEGGNTSLGPPVGELEVLFSEIEPVR